jgi:hypothetical protein
MKERSAHIRNLINRLTDFRPTLRTRLQIGNFLSIQVFAFSGIEVFTSLFSTIGRFELHVGGEKMIREQHCEISSFEKQHGQSERAV